MTRCPCPWPAGLCGQLLAGLTVQGAGRVRTSSGCEPRAHTQQPALISQALQCSGRVFLVIVKFFP